MSGRFVRLSVAALVSFATIAVPALAGFVGTDCYLPSVGRRPGAGGSQWYTTVWVYNPNPAAATVQFSLLERDKVNLSPISFATTIDPGATARFEDAVWTLFHVEAFGAIRVTADKRLLVSSRIYSRTGELKNSTGQFFAGIPAAFAIAAGQRTDILGVYQTQPSESSDFRYNYGFVETAGATATVKVTVMSALGAALGDKTYTLREREQKQYAFKDDFPAISTQNARLSVEVLSGSGRVIAFGSGVANGSNDPSTFEMAFPEELLGTGGAPFLLTSSAFAHNTRIPNKYTCDAQNVSPPLTWTNPPAGTQSFVLHMHDPGAPQTWWVHWLLFNIPASARSLAEGIPATGQLADGSRHARNSSGQNAYGGPCPPSGTHPYVFDLYAVDQVVSLAAGATRDQVFQAIAGHTLAHAQLIGLYNR